MYNLRRFTIACAIFLFLAATSIASPAQTFSLLATFNGEDGAAPEAPLVQGLDGNFYGTTDLGGTGSCIPAAEGCGTVFQITPGGKLTTLHKFCSQPNCPDGNTLTAPLALGIDANFYGTTQFGGGSAACLEEQGCGTVFKISPAGKLTTLHIFNGTDSFAVSAGLVQAANGIFYGTTTGSFNCEGQGDCGTVFRITPGGTLTTLYTFCSQPNCADGAEPYAPLVQATDGNFYGTTSAGGSNNSNCLSECGTVFKITPGGKLTTLYEFCLEGICSDGQTPNAGLVEGADGSFYGTTLVGGISNEIVCILGCGTVFKITPGGELTTIYKFCSLTNCADGGEPSAALVRANDGNFYGTTVLGANPTCADGSGCGTAFKITPGGTLTTLYTFCSQPNCADGGEPFGGLVQGTDGKFYGTAGHGGVPDCIPNFLTCGTVYSLSTGLGPFVGFVRPAAKVGQTGGILGQGFTGTSSVMLNGTPATFTVVSDTFIEATVPVGATTGYVTVTTPSGLLTSNIPFHVIP
jgi:uncharacterized repeat protein (TIGR03803 family)